MMSDGHNKISGPNAGGPRQSAIRTWLAGRVGQFTVMRKRKFVAFTLVFAIAIAAAVLTLRQRPGTTPVVSLGLIGYSSVITYPNGTRWIQACVGLTNTCAVSLSYGDWGSVPRHWIRAETAARPIRYGLHPGPRVGNGVLLPGSNEVLWLVIPADTVRWKYGLSVRGASTGERFAGGIISVAIRSGVYPLCRRLLDLLPHKPGPEKEFESEWLEVPNALHNHSKQRTGASRSARAAVVVEWRLAPAADAEGRPSTRHAL